jgi:hypothetical protein
LVRSRSFELSFRYVFLEAKIMLGCGEKLLIGRSSCWLLWFLRGLSSDPRGNIGLG